METKELKITIPENHEIDWQESAKQEKIVFKKKEVNKPRSWEEYCKNFKGQYYYIQDNRDNIATSFIPNGYGLVSAYKNYIPSKELAEAFLAMMQLMSLRQAWIGDWNSNLLGYDIMLDVKRDIMVSHDIYHRALTFPMREIAVDFMNCFRDLLEIAKPLL